MSSQQMARESSLKRCAIWQVNCSAIADKRAFSSLETTFSKFIVFMVYLAKMSVAYCTCVRPNGGENVDGRGRGYMMSV